MSKRVIVTGSTGFVGRHLIPKLLEKENSVIEVTRDVQKSKDFYGDQTKKIDVLDPNFEEKIKSYNPDIAIHLAAFLTSSDDWEAIEKLVDTNLLFLSKILNALKTTNLRCFINTGTFAEYFYGNDILQPGYFYAATKSASRSIVNYFSKTYNFKHITVVPYTIYGGEDSQKKIIDFIFDSLDSEVPLELSPGEQILDFIHIEDVIDFYCNLVHNFEQIPNGVNFKLGTGKGTSLKDLANLVETISGKKACIHWGGKPYRKSDIMYAVADIAGSNTYTDWVPKISLQEGLKKMKNDH